MGLHFAHLLADCESLKASKAVVSERTLGDVIQSSEDIINIFLDTTDERTRHLTDHVYNVVTFADAFQNLNSGMPNDFSQPYSKAYNKSG